MKTLYTCGFCGNYGMGGFDKPEDSLEHEKKCDHNPANKTCATCQHYESKEDEFDEEHYHHWCAVFKDNQWRRQCVAHIKRQA